MTHLQIDDALVDEALAFLGCRRQRPTLGFFAVTPMVLAGFLDGTLIDRLGYKRTSILADLASGVTIALIPLLHFTIGLEFWQLLVLVFQGALLDTAGNTVCAALLPDLAEEAGMPIERVTFPDAGVPAQRVAGNSAGIKLKGREAKDVRP
jgi:MFS family permease